MGSNPENVSDFLENSKESKTIPEILLRFQIFCWDSKDFDGFPKIPEILENSTDSTLIQKIVVRFKRF